MKIGLYLDDVSLKVLKKGLFVSCEPVESITKLAPGLIEERLSEVGETYLVANLNKETQGKACLTDAFVTTFGAPEELLLDFMGFPGDVEKFKKAYADFYLKQFPDQELIDDTELFVCVYEPVSDS